jgi:hypothetical protein
MLVRGEVAGGRTEELTTKENTVKDSVEAVRRNRVYQCHETHLFVPRTRQTRETTLPGGLETMRCSLRLKRYNIYI